MKKSYFAIGAIAATMCSCSSESIPSAGEGNVLPGTEDLSPISLSMTGKQTTVEVGSRTRGTGNVGGDNGTTWQNEKLYILMTSSDTLCLVGTDKTAGWGFTNLDGEGPWLKEQFNGAIWARPKQNGDTWDLVYNHDHNLKNNDWYQGAGVNRFYPINGASDFFAYHIDDAAAETNNASIYTASTGSAYTYPEQALDEAYPKITRNDDTNEMTVNFEINGSQDLLAGRAERVSPYNDGFSAKSARHDVVPKISMKHLLSRLTFTIYRGDEMAKNIQITGITIKKVRNQGRMIVAYKQVPSNSSLIQWKRPGADAESPNDDTYDEGALDSVQTYYRTDFKLMQSPANILGDPTTETDALTSIKNNLAPLAPFNVSGITNWLQPSYTGTDYYKTIGSPMFVAPGETKYEMTLYYKVLVRDTDGDGEFDEPVFDDETGALTSGDLIEQMRVTYSLNAPANTEDNNTFAQGKSYNIKITVYGLKPITATVELTPWTEAGDVWIGGDNEDNTPENLPNPNPGQGQNPGEGTDPGQGEGNDQGQGGENGQGQGPNPGGNENPGGEAEPAA